jgi:hypothetical protein
MVLVEAARCISGPCKEAVGEMGSPPTGCAAVVERRREHRVTGAQARTERRSLETIGPNFKGSRQSQPGEVTQRSKHAGKKNDSRGLDNRGNIDIEGNSNDLLAPPLREHSQRPTARRRAAQCGLDMLRRMEEG